MRAWGNHTRCIFTQPFFISYSLFSKWFPPIYLNMKRGSTLSAVFCQGCVKNPVLLITCFFLYLFNLSFCLSCTHTRTHTPTYYNAVHLPSISFVVRCLYLSEGWQWNANEFSCLLRTWVASAEAWKQMLGLLIPLPGWWDLGWPSCITEIF